MQVKNKKEIWLNGRGLKAGIVVARFNHEITEKLLESTKNSLTKSGISGKNIHVISVAGSIEIPYALHKLARSKRYDFLVALGCVIKGDTSHFDYVCKMAQEGVLKVMIEDNIPVGFGVLTLNNSAQARGRFHIGGEAALAALELALIK